MVVLPLLDADDAGLIAALRGADLPDPGDGRYFTAHERGGLTGYVGLEGEGRDLLLRSLVVLADRKAQGIGSRILTAAEAVAIDLGGNGFTYSPRRPSASSPGAASSPPIGRLRRPRSGEPASSRTSARRRPPI